MLAPGFVIDSSGNFGISFGIPMVTDETELAITVAFQKEG